MKTGALVPGDLVSVQGSAGRGLGLVLAVAVDQLATSTPGAKLLRVTVLWQWGILTTSSWSDWDLWSSFLWERVS